MNGSPKPWSNSLKQVDELLEFVRSLAPKDLFDRLDTATDRAAVLYNALRSNRPESDDHIMSITRMDPRQHQRALSELKSILISALLYLDLPRGGYDELGCRLYELNLARARARVLSLFRPGITQYEMSRTVFEEAIRLEEWDVGIKMISALLANAVQEGDRFEVSRLISLREQFKEIQHALDRAEEFWSRIIVEARLSISFEKPAATEVALEAILYLTPIVERMQTYRLQEYLIRIRSVQEETVSNYKGSLALSLEWEALLEKFPVFSTRVRRGRIGINKVIALLRLGRNTEARSAVDSAAASFVRGSSDWFTLHDSEFTLQMHTRCFESAFRLVEEVEGTRGFKGLSELERENWRINRLTAELLSGRKLSAKFDVRTAKPGDITRSLLAEFPSFKEDYGGHYMTAIILEVLICLESHQGQMYLIDRIESLLKFRQRRLKDRPESQAYLFIEMLRLLVKHDFSRREFVLEADSLHERLVNPLPNDPTRNELILPYEVLWDEVVTRLPEEPWLSD